MSENITFNQDGTVIPTANSYVEFRLSWVAYIRETWAFVLRFFVCAVVGTLIIWVLENFYKMKDVNWPAVVAIAVTIAWTVYSVVSTRAVRVITDENGVWVSSGVFPWEKGVRGLHWRDIGQASFTQGFVSWALKSYNIEVSPRVMESAKIYLRNVQDGEQAVMHINGILSRMQDQMLAKR